MKPSRILPITLCALLACNDEPNQNLQQQTFGSYQANTLCEVAVDFRKPEPLKEQTETLRQFTEKDIVRIQGHPVNKLDGDILTIFYFTASEKLFSNDHDDIRKYLKSLPKGSNVVVEGFADFRGPLDTNDLLSYKRAKGVRDWIVGLRHDINVTLASYGESKSQPEGTDRKLLLDDRKVNIVPNKSVIGRGLDFLPADFYLVDQSGSMGDYLGEKTKWEQVQEYNFPQGSKVSTFTSSARQCGGKLSNEQPMGGTPLYHSLLRLVERAENGKRITVLSDGQDTEGGSNLVDSIIQRANAKGLQISYVKGLAGDDPLLERIRTHTGGGSYKVR